jgi:4-hydroxy-tetrahydrodipicolinate synthase
MFTGLYTAIITPFDASGALDETAFRKLVSHQMDGNVDGIVICGTTGESPTISDPEFTRLIELAKETAAGKAQVIAGVGSNSTEHVLHRCRLAEAIGVDGLLIVVPYYNKPTQESLIAHFTHIADRVTTPIMLYNVPGRTAVNMLPATVAALAVHPRIAAVKEACGEINQVMDLIAAVPKGFAVLSGDDAMTLPMIAAGATGLVSVASNQAPGMMKAYVDACTSGNFEEARKHHYRLLPLMKINFIESNPLPVKFAMAHMGFCENVLRLPLTPLTRKNQEPVLQVLKNLGLPE